MTNVYHPAPVNQFYRLEADEFGKVYRKTTRWNHRHLNANGVMTEWDGAMCMATAGAIALDAHTGGAKTASPGSIHDHQSDMLGGIGVDDVRTSWANGWRETLYVPGDFDWSDSIYAVRVQRRVMIVGVDYGDVPYQFQMQKGGTFDHAIVIEDFRDSDSEIRRYEGLATNPLWTPQSAYRAAAESLAQRVRGTKGRLFVAFTKPRPLIGQEYRVAISGYTPLYVGPGGVRDGAVRLATYRCSRGRFVGATRVSDTDTRGLWWFRIAAKGDGGTTANVGKWFKPNRYTDVTA